MRADQQPSAQKRVVFGLIIVLVVVFAVEALTRGVFAFTVGPRVLLYGTESFRDARAIPSAIMAKVGYTPPTPDAPIATYAKFAPHEVKYDRDENGERFSPTINSRGFRGDEFSDEKAPGVVRVVALGASSTFGYHDRDDETYPHYLEEILNTEAEAEAGKTFEVINLGIPHITTDQILALFISEAMPLNPDMITVYAGLNDSREGWQHVVEQREGFGSVYEYVRERSLMFAFLDSFLYYAGTKRFFEEDLRNLSAGKGEKFVANLAAIREECLRRGIVFIAATQQANSTHLKREQLKGVTYSDEVAMLREQLTGPGVKRRELAFLVHDGVMRDLRSWAHENEVPLVDVISLLDEDRSVLLSHVHLNPQGNRKMAQAIAGEIRNQLRAAAHQSMYTD